jgi:hypothetical protein
MRHAARCARDDQDGYARPRLAGTGDRYNIASRAAHEGPRRAVFYSRASFSRVVIPNAIARREVVARPFGLSLSRRDSKFRWPRVVLQSGQERVGCVCECVCACAGGKVEGCAGRREAHFRYTAGGVGRAGATLSRKRVLSHVTWPQSTARMERRGRNRAGCAIFRLSLEGNPGHPACSRYPTALWPCARGLTTSAVT